MPDAAPAAARPTPVDATVVDAAPAVAVDAVVAVAADAAPAAPPGPLAAERPFLGLVLATTQFGDWTAEHRAGIELVIFTRACCAMGVSFELLPRIPRTPKELMKLLPGTTVSTLASLRKVEGLVTEDDGWAATLVGKNEGRTLDIKLYAHVRWRDGAAYLCSATIDGIYGSLPTAEETEAICQLVR